MTDREVMQQALHELEGIPVYRKYGVRISNAIAALRKALEQPEQEPTCPECEAAVLYECVACSSNNYPPKPEQEPVGEVLNERGEIDYISYVPPVGTSVYTAPFAAQPEQEPVAPDDESICDDWISASDSDGIAYDGPSFECGYKIGRIAERDAKPAPTQVDITIEDDDALSYLRDMVVQSDGELTPIRLLVGDGHSGRGLYIASADYTDEGAIKIADVADTPPAAQPEQEPDDGFDIDGLKDAAYALEAILQRAGEGATVGHVIALLENLAQPEQEPVACVIDGDLYFHHEIDWEDLAYQGHGVELLYTTPLAAQPEQVDCPRCGHVCSQREWQGLTHQQTKDCVQGWDGNDAYVLCRAIEAKLKERNT